MSKQNDGPEIPPALFERAKAGDSRAVDVVLAALRPTILTRATSAMYGNADAGEDITQDVLLVLFQKLSKVESAEKLMPYVQAVINTTAKAAKRKFATEAEHITYSSDLADAATEGGYINSSYGRHLGDGNYYTPAAGSSDDLYE